ncbi:uncharacterized protein LOC127702896 [Mytilus californianus]|nr:uncharacterized protein LOC127702896 [Mytilus californianus]
MRRKKAEKMMRKTISPKTVTTDATQNKKKRGLAVAEKTHPQKPPVLRKASTSSESAYNPFDDTDTEDTDQITSCDQVAPTQIARSKKKGKDHSQSTEKKRKRHPDTSDGEDASASSQPESKRRRKEIPSQKKTKTPRGLALAKNSKPKKQQTTPKEKSCEEDSSEENRCEENSSEKNSCEENSSEENSSEENSSEENSSEENSSEDNSSGSSMIITDDSDEESAEQEEKKEYYFENEEIKEFIKASGQAGISKEESWESPKIQGRHQATQQTDSEKNPNQKD